MIAQLPTAKQAKTMAKELRSKLASKGSAIGHAKSLELIAQQLGFRDWNTLSAAMEASAPTGWRIGDRVTGKYLAQPFSAKVVSVTRLRPGWHRLELHLDTPVDVVKFDSFSNLRTRVRGTVGPDGHSKERTSDGLPQLQIDC